ncbi:MAG: alanine racemase [Rhodospirillales bacterium]|nr:alanine racemase [Alphaproteobacteria bacterium]MCB1839332.1 alanine racemase [Alphaproteobacteria bacterium]MCB9977316.1 alanine racemase [Rhodospirillales bacterium]
MCARSGNLVIDLAALQCNYVHLDSLSDRKCETAATIKADAYGLGAGPVAQALYKAGCRTFFVATFEEAAELRTALPPETTIAILGGYDQAFKGEYSRLTLIPVLNSLYQIEKYRSEPAEGSKHPAFLHFDTGMNRLGLEKSETRLLSENKELLAGINVDSVMSHFACSDEKDSPMNPQQHKAFMEIAKLFQGVKRSLCNSSAIFRSNDYHLEMNRPGMALYGLNPTPERTNPMTPVVHLTVPVLQIREAQKAETAGYNATHRFGKKTKLVVAGAGYADGFFRSLSNEGVLYWKEYALPVRGRVSMDLVICDLENVSEHEHPVPGDMLEIIGPHQSADDLAAAAGTIGYEVLTALGRRYKRKYAGEK